MKLAWLVPHDQRRETERRYCAGHSFEQPAHDQAIVAIEPKIFRQFQRIDIWLELAKGHYSDHTASQKNSGRRDDAAGENKNCLTH
jgi:hypothetical protein